MFQVLFYKTPSGNDVIRDFLRQFTKDQKKKIGEDLKAVQIGFPMGLPLCDNLGGGIWEVRSSLSKIEVRLLFCFDSAGQRLVILHAFVKKRQKTPKKDLDLAKSRKSELL